MYRTFSKQQVNTIYGSWKRNEIQVERDVINKLYFYAENGIKGFNREGNSMNYCVDEAVKAIFQKRFDRAEKFVNGFANWARAKERNDMINGKAIA